MADHAETVAFRVNKLKQVMEQPGHGTIKGAKFGPNRSTFSTRYAVYRQTDTTDNKGRLIVLDKIGRLIDQAIQYLSRSLVTMNTEDVNYFFPIH